MKNGCFFIFILLIAACSKGYGEKIEGGNTTVFYTDKNEKVLAEKFLAQKDLEIKLKVEILLYSTRIRMKK